VKRYDAQGKRGLKCSDAQGLIAGINACMQLEGKKPIVMHRSDSYIGVLIDDIVTKGTAEPYRMMTSRAEYRLLLRQDNADLRLTPIGYEAGLISEERYKNFLKKKDNIEREIERVRQTVVRATEESNKLLEAYGSSKISAGVKLADLLKRSELSYEKLAPLDADRPELSKQESEQVDLQLKYEGYIKLQMAQVQRFKKLENKMLPQEIDYTELKGISLEARQKLNKLKPVSIGQASRISGVSPADINVLLIYLEQWKKNGD